MNDYIVATDSHALTGTQSARLYVSSRYRNRYTLAATGTLAQIQELADRLNAGTEND